MLFLTGCDDFFEPKIYNKTVSIVAPVASARVPEGEVSFCWNVLDGADRYRITIVSPSFAEAASLICDVTIVADSAAVSCLHIETLSGGEYEWSLSGLNSAYFTKETISGLTVYANDTEE